MKAYTTIARFASTITGAGILAASAYAIIIMSQQDFAHALVTSALAVGLFVGSCVICHVRGWLLALLMVSTLFAGEAANTLLSADRVVTERQAASAKIAEKLKAHNYAQTEQARAQVAYDDAVDAIKKQSPLKDCRTGCIAALEKSKSDAKVDLDRARELAEHNPEPTVSGSALADSLGVPAWKFDLALAVLIALGANGLAATLIAFGCHTHKEKTVKTKAPQPVRVEPPTQPAGWPKGTEAWAQPAAYQMPVAPQPAPCATDDDEAAHRRQQALQRLLA